MSDDIVTVATYTDAVEASMARNALEAAGIRAFLADDNAATMVGHLSGAMGGVKVLVLARDANRARAVLADCEPAHDDDYDDYGDAETDGGAPPGPNGVHARHAEDEPEPVLSQREQNADRALKAAGIGMLFMPLEFYVTWLLIDVFTSDQPLSPARRNKAIVAAVLNVFVLAVYALMFGLLPAGRVR